MQSTSSLAFKLDDRVAAWPSDYSYEAPTPRNTSWGTSMPISNRSIDRTVSAHRRQITSLRDAKQENQDWLAARISRQPVSDIVEKTGMSERAVHNIRQRKCKISFDNLVDLCRNDPSFAADFASYIGLIRPGEAEMADAVTRLVNAHARREAP